MPTGAFHSHYWQIQAPEVPIVAGASARGGYPVTWQPTIVGMLALVLLILQGA